MARHDQARAIRGLVLLVLTAVSCTLAAATGEPESCWDDADVVAWDLSLNFVHLLQLGVPKLQLSSSSSQHGFSANTSSSSTLTGAATNGSRLLGKARARIKTESVGIVLNDTRSQPHHSGGDHPLRRTVWSRGARSGERRGARHSSLVSRALDMGLEAWDRGPVTLLERAAATSSSSVDSKLEGSPDSHRVSNFGRLQLPMVAIALGVMLLPVGFETVGLLLLYFGAQAGFSLFMKVVFSNLVVSEELSMHGVPAAFLVTAVQQVIAFILMVICMGCLWHTQWRYTPKSLHGWKDWGPVLLFSLTFAMNIGLNNFSLSLLPVSMNLVIRSCLPLMTLAMQVLASHVGQAASCGGWGVPRVRPLEVVFMVVGVLCAGLATVAKKQGQAGGFAEDYSKYLILGVAICMLSNVAGAANLVLASLWTPAKGSPGLRLNAVDATLYMSVPAALLLAPAVAFVDHPVDWPNYGRITDLEILRIVCRMSPWSLLPIFASGIAAAGYNVLQYALVQYLSATHTAFAGNVNKAATIMISICMGLETLPSGVWSSVMIFAIIGNILSFTGYSVVRALDL